MEQIKIYPSKHKIELINESRFDTDLNIPLSYINLDYTKYKIDKTIHNDFLQSDVNRNIKMIPILPGEEIPDIEKLVFNKHEEVINPLDYYKKIGAKYYFTPMYEFIPNKFSYNVVAKKNMTYKTSNKYNINVACIDDSDSLDLSSRLAKILINPASRQLVPPNISINNNTENITTLTDMSYEEADFVFMETHDGYWLDADHNNEAMISNFLDDNVNVWVGCDDHYYYRYTNDDMGYMTFGTSGLFQDFELKRSLLSTNTSIRSKNYFNLNRSEYINQPEKNIYNLFTDRLSPVLIVEHIGKGFEIISHNDVLQNPENYKDLIFEVMMYVYLISYRRSRTVNEWITYTIPDYEVINNVLYTKKNFSSSYTLNDLLNITNGDYSIYNINIYDLGPGNNFSLQRRLKNPRDVPKERWIENAKNNRISYEKPTKSKEKITKIYTMY